MSVTANTHLLNLTFLVPAALTESFSDQFSRQPCKRCPRGPLDPSVPCPYCWLLPHFKYT